MNKINRGDVLWGNKNMMKRIKTYFAYNEITSKKIDILENGTGLNLSEIRQLIKQ